jgi:hypothetical protein
MTNPITARLDALNITEPPTVRLARGLLLRAQDQLREQLRRGADDRVIEAYRYAVLRAHDRLQEAWHDAARAVAR